MISVEAMADELIKIAAIKCRTRAVPIRVSNLAKKETMDKRLYKKASIPGQDIDLLKLRPEIGGVSYADLWPSDIKYKEKRVPLLGRLLTGKKTQPAAYSERIPEAKYRAYLASGGTPEGYFNKKASQQKEADAKAEVAKGLLRRHGSKLALVGGSVAAWEAGKQAKGDYVMGRQYRRQMEKSRK